MYQRDQTGAKSGPSVITWRNRHLETLSQSELRMAIEELIDRPWIGGGKALAFKEPGAVFFSGAVCGLIAGLLLTCLALVLAA